MPLHVNSTFVIETIQVQKFHFEQTQGLENSIGVEFNQEIDAKYILIDSKIMHVFLGHKLTMIQKDQPIYTIDSIIMGRIQIEKDFDLLLVNNVVAILYSYLRPMVAQITVMAKLPPVDLPPMNFSDLRIEELENT